MCKPKCPKPMNCDVFCSEDNNTREHFGDINITGNLFVDKTIPFRANNISVGENFEARKSTVVANDITVKDSLVFDKDCYFRFSSLDVSEKCVVGKPHLNSNPKPTPIDCDVFCINGFVPDNICITGNLYIKGAEFLSDCGDFDVGEDIFIESSRIRTHSIKSQGTIYVDGKTKKGFGFFELVALRGCKIYLNTTQGEKQ